jgi:hypothetical protein
MLGSINRVNKSEGYIEMESTVFFKHEQFVNSGSFLNDVALIRLPWPVTLTSKKLNDADFFDKMRIYIQIISN